MRQTLPLILFALLALEPCLGLSSEHDKYLPNWLELLDKGNEREKKVALNNLWILKYPEHRKDSKVFDPVLKALKDNNPSVREAAASYLRHLGESSKGCCKETGIIPSLIEALEDGIPRVREEAAKALSHYKDGRSIKPLIQKLKDESPWVRLSAVASLGELNAGEAFDPLLHLLEDDSDWRNKFVQQECLRAIRKIIGPSKRVAPVIMGKFNDEYLKPEIIKTFGTLSIIEARPLLIEASKDPNEKIRRLALEAISRTPLPSDLNPSIGKAGPPDVETIIESLNDPSEKVRAESAQILERLRDKRSVSPLLDALNDQSSMVREKAVIALGGFSEERILDPLIDFILKSSNAQFRDSAEKSFQSVAHKTCKGWVYLYWKEEVKYETRNLSDIPRGKDYAKSMIHPDAVNKLISVYSPDPDTQVRLLNIIDLFRDSRIEGYVVKCLESPSAPVRQKAVYLLIRFPVENAVPKLLQAIRDGDRGVRIEAIERLGYFKEKRALEPLIEMLNESDDGVRAAALRALGKLDEPKVSDLSVELLRDRADSVRTSAIWNLKKKPDNRAVEPLISLLNDPDWLTPSNVAETLGIIGDKRAVEPLIEALKGKFSKNRRSGGDLKLRQEAARALGVIGDNRAVEPLMDALKSDKDLKYHATKALGLIGDKRAVEPLIEVLLTDKNGSLRTSAAEGLGNIGDERAIESLKTVLRTNPSFPLNHACNTALEKIKKKKIQNNDRQGEK